MTDRHVVSTLHRLDDYGNKISLESIANNEDYLGDKDGRDHCGYCEEVLTWCSCGRSK